MTFGTSIIVFVAISAGCFLVGLLMGRRQKNKEVDGYKRLADREIERAVNAHEKIDKLRESERRLRKKLKALQAEYRSDEIERQGAHDEIDSGNMDTVDRIIYGDDDSGSK